MSKLCICFLQHPFLQSDLTRRLTREILDRVRNPQQTSYDLQPDEDDEVTLY